MASATCVDLARLIAQAGIDVVIAQGMRPVAIGDFDHTATIVK